MEIRKFINRTPLYIIGIGVVAIGAIVLAMWDSWPTTSAKIFPELAGQGVDKLGQFGDSFGALNTLFTGVAFVGLLFTILIQLYERREREEERAEEKRAQYASDFETRFFRLHDSLRQVVGEMIVLRFDTGRAVPEKMGKDIFAHYVEKIISQKRNREELTGDATEGLQSWISEYRAFFAGRSQDDLAPYFRMLYRIVCYIEKSAGPNKYEFTEIVRAELSPSELKLLALNCLTTHGRKFKPLVERYHFLKHLPEDDDYFPKKLFLTAFDLSAFYDDDEPRPQIAASTIPPLAALT